MTQDSCWEALNRSYCQNIPCLVKHPTLSLAILIQSTPLFFSFKTNSTHILQSFHVISFTILSQNFKISLIDWEFKILWTVLDSDVWPPMATGICSYECSNVTSAIRQAVSWRCIGTWRGVALQVMAAIFPCVCYSRNQTVWINDVAYLCCQQSIRRIHISLWFTFFNNPF
jgi:hypothetical protein